MLILENISRTDVILILFVLLIIFIFITLTYMFFSQKKQNNINQSILDERMEKIHDENLDNENLQVNEDEEKAVVSLYELPIKKIDAEEKDIETITKELENLPREINFEMTPYEKVQEEKAIISYDELVKQKENSSIAYHDDVSDEEVLVKQVDLDKTGMIELDPIKKEMNTKVSLSSYKHEEEFLDSLKDLNSLLD